MALGQGFVLTQLVDAFQLERNCQGEIMEIFKVIASIVCILMTDSCWANLARESRGVHLTVPKGTGNSAAVASAVRSLNTKMDKQNEALNRLADATEHLATKTAPPSCIMTEKYGYTRIQLEPTSKPFDVFCEQAINEGGWTLVLQRFNGTSRTAQEYRNGYNSIQAGEYFLGTDKLYALTHSRLHELIFVMEFNNLTNSIFQAPRFVLNNPAAYSLWAQEHEISRYSWTQWQSDAARLEAEQSWESFERCQPGEALCGLERFLVFLLKWKFTQDTYNPLSEHLPIRLFKLLVRPSNAYWTVPV